MFAHRTNQKTIETAIDSPYITAILGPRRVGKTTLVTHLAKKYPERTWIFFNMDHLFQRERIESGQFLNMIEEKALRNIGTHPMLWVVVDEAQKCPALFEQIKILYDDHKNNQVIKFILTGSAMLSLHQLSAETLAGRISLHYLDELGLRETVGLLHTQEISNLSTLDTILSKNDNITLESLIKQLNPYKALLEQALDTQTIWGGLPEMLMQNADHEKITYLANYLETYLTKDIRDIETVSDIKLYRQLMQIIAEQTGSLRDDSKLLQALRCNRATLQKYRGYLEATLVYQEVYPYINSTVKRLVKSPKAYLKNNGIISYLTGIYDLSILKNTGEIGHRFENWFLKELNIWQHRTPINIDIFYWRTHTNLEVDFIVNVHPTIYPFEVTYGQHVERKKLRHLSSFLTHEKKAPYGIYLYNGDYKFDKEKRILFLPAWLVG